MELAIPLIALSGLYVMSKQGSNNSNGSAASSSKEQFTVSKNERLPNTDVPDVNYPPDAPISTNIWDRSSTLINDNRYDGGSAYTDKYFAPALNSNARISSVSENPSSSVSGKSAPASQYYSMTGEKVDLDYFQHSNMTPYFGGHIRSPLTSANSNESQLDAMNGTGSQYISKRENAPLFAPETNLQWAYGVPNSTDFVQSRMNVGMRMANVNPFKEEKVGPGLGLGYTSAGEGGFNAGMAMRESWMDRGVDELRVANKQKASGLMLIGREGPANSQIKNLAGREQMGVVEKNRPDTSFEIGRDRLFTTTGVEKGQTMRAIPVERYVSRPETTASYSGGAGHTTTEMVYGEYMPSHNHSLGEVPVAVANANGRGYGTDADYGVKSQTLYANNRSENSPGEYFGGLGSTIGAVVAPLMDILRPSRKENSVGTLRPYQNPGSTVPQSYFFNPGDRPATTIRDTTGESIGHMNVDKTLYQRGAYEVTPVDPKETTREVSSRFYQGTAGSDRTREARPYDAEYSQRNNEIKSSAVEQTSYMTKGNMSLLNSDINMRARPREVANTRPVQPSMPYQTADIANMGSTRQSAGLYSNIELDRTTPDVLSGLKTNPYAIQRVF
jgi:hypothetical protein